MAAAVTLAEITASTDRVLRALAALDGAAMAAPSRLPDWTVGQVVAHLALNAEAFVRVSGDLQSGLVGVMYPHGVDGRSADIAALGAAPARELLIHLRTASDAFAAAWSGHVPDGPCATVPGAPEFASAEVPMRRLREVEVHGTDTGLDALEPASWSDAYVDAELSQQWATVARRTTDAVGIIDELGARWTANASGDRFVELDRRTLLAWVLDRATPPAAGGLPQLLSWGDPSSWSAGPT